MYTTHAHIHTYILKGQYKEKIFIKRISQDRKTHYAQRNIKIYKYYTLFGIGSKDKVLGGTYSKFGIAFVLMFPEEIIGSKRTAPLLKSGKITKSFPILATLSKNNFC